MYTPDIYLIRWLPNINLQYVDQGTWSANTILTNGWFGSNGLCDNSPRRNVKITSWEAHHIQKEGHYSISSLHRTLDSFLAAPEIPGVQVLLVASYDWAWTKLCTTSGMASSQPQGAHTTPIKEQVLFTEVNNYLEWWQKFFCLVTYMFCFELFWLK